MARPFPACTGDESHIFVSYAHEDSDVVFPEIPILSVHLQAMELDGLERLIPQK